MTAFVRATFPAGDRARACRAVPREILDEMDRPGAWRRGAANFGCGVRASSSTLTGRSNVRRVRCT